MSARTYSVLIGVGGFFAGMIVWPFVTGLSTLIAAGIVSGMAVLSSLTLLKLLPQPETT